jgi:hypothetical protein
MHWLTTEPSGGCCQRGNEPSELHTRKGPGLTDQLSDWRRPQALRPAESRAVFEQNPPIDDGGGGGGSAPAKERAPTETLATNTATAVDRTSLNCRRHSDAGHVWGTKPAPTVVLRTPSHQLAALLLSFRRPKTDNGKEITGAQIRKHSRRTTLREKREN